MSAAPGVRSSGAAKPGLYDSSAAARTPPETSAALPKSVRNAALPAARPRLLPRPDDVAAADVEVQQAARVDGPERREDALRHAQRVLHARQIRKARIPVLLAPGVGRGRFLLPPAHERRHRAHVPAPAREHGIAALLREKSDRLKALARGRHPGEALARELRQILLENRLLSPVRGRTRCVRSSRSAPDAG